MAEKKAKKNVEAATVEHTEAASVVSTPEEQKPLTVIRRAKPKFNSDDRIMVTSGYGGTLVFVSKKSGIEHIWEQRGDWDWLTIDELMEAVRTMKMGFEQNYFLFEDPAVVEFLGMDKYYANAMSAEQLTDLLTLPAEELEAKAASLSTGQKELLAYVAMEKISTGELDSRSKIAGLEKALGVLLLARE